MAAAVVMTAARPISGMVIGMAVVYVMRIAINSVVGVRTGFRTVLEGTDSVLVILCPWAAVDITVEDRLGFLLGGCGRLRNRSFLENRLFHIGR